MPYKREPDPWPWPADTQVERVRRVALSYREALRMHLPDLAARIDEHMVSVGQAWVRPKIAQYEPDDLLDTNQAAEYCGVKPRTLATWRENGLPVHNTPDGIRHKVSDLVEYEAAKRRRRVKT